MSEIMLSEQMGNSSSPSHNTQAQGEGGVEGGGTNVFKTVTQELEYLKYDVQREKSSIRNAILTVAVLIGTATYQAAINPPRGLWQDDDTSKQPIHIAGASILAAKHPFQFGMFMFGNTLGFSLSFSIIEYLLRDCPLSCQLKLCLFAVGFTYGLNLSTLTPTQYMPYHYTFSLTFIPLLLPPIIILRDYPKIWLQKFNKLFHK